MKSYSLSSMLTRYQSRQSAIPFRIKLIKNSQIGYKKSTHLRGSHAWFLQAVTKHFLKAHLMQDLTTAYGHIALVRPEMIDPEVGVRGIDDCKISNLALFNGSQAVIPPKRFGSTDRCPL